MQLSHIISRNQNDYAKRLEAFLEYAKFIWKIPLRAGKDPVEPYWLNGFLAPFDGIALYSMVALNQPAHYIEIGSGFSTLFTSRAKKDNHLSTKIISIDPEPRHEISSICDQIIPTPLERADLGVFSSLTAKDMIYVDSSHRCFTNSDVTVFFLDVLPRIRPGVIVHFHDIFLPNDYPPAWADRYYSEQYLLAVLLLAESTKIKILLPSTFVGYDERLYGILTPVWRHPMFENIKKEGCSFWIEIGKS